MFSYFILLQYMATALLSANASDCFDLSGSKHEVISSVLRALAWSLPSIEQPSDVSPSQAVLIDSIDLIKSNQPVHSGLISRVDEIISERNANGGLQGENKEALDPVLLFFTFREILNNLLTLHNLDFNSLGLMTLDSPCSFCKKQLLAVPCIWNRHDDFPDVPKDRRRVCCSSERGSKILGGADVKGRPKQVIIENVLNNVLVPPVSKKFLMNGAVYSLSVILIESFGTVSCASVGRALRTTGTQDTFFDYAKYLKKDQHDVSLLYIYDLVLDHPENVCSIDFSQVPAVNTEGLNISPTTAALRVLAWTLPSFQGDAKLALDYCLLSSLRKIQSRQRADTDTLARVAYNVMDLMKVFFVVDAVTTFFAIRTHWLDEILAADQLDRQSLELQEVVKNSGNCSNQKKSPGQKRNISVIVMDVELTSICGIFQKRVFRGSPKQIIIEIPTKVTLPINIDHSISIGKANFELSAILMDEKETGESNAVILIKDGFSFMVHSGKSQNISLDTYTSSGRMQIGKRPRLLIYSYRKVAA